MLGYFLDSYALIEMVKGNPKYEKYLDFEFFTSVFNLYEFYFSLLKDFNEQTANKYFYEFKKRVISVKDENIFAASKFKLENKKKCLSYADCIGYAMSLNLNVKFLTGDKEFEGLDNVEFVKK